MNECWSNVSNFCFLTGNLTDIDIEGLVLTPVTLIVKKRPDKNFIKKRMYLVLKKEGMKLKCACQASHDSAVASAEEEIDVNEPPMQGKCKLIDG